MADQRDQALTIRVDPEICVGTASCVRWLPGVFGLDEDGLATVLDPGAGSVDEIVACAQGCPTGAITVIRGGERLAGDAG